MACLAAARQTVIVMASFWHISFHQVRAMSVRHASLSHTFSSKLVFEPQLDQKKDIHDWFVCIVVFTVDLEDRFP